MHQHDSSTGTAGPGTSRPAGGDLAAARTATGDTGSADILRPYTVAATARREARVCWINREPLEPGTAAFLDGGGLAVCAGCAAHCTTCTSEECDHPRYAYLAGAFEVAALAAEAAAALTAAYGRDAEVRYDADGVRGGAWLKTADGGNADVGIAASAVTAGTPAGAVTVYAHIRGGAVREGLRAELAALDGWHGRETTGVRGGYHYGPAGSVQDALDRCLRFIPVRDAR